ncbi:hypothetical protein [Natrarchaeobaculum aegyptiacum]|uniref:Uncharacterized protein n=1 Tax=Natrarchaeobaculum aegyptiacum TaxID=745377 RepID=A0A2Z2HTU0_9EURY|nr:hypothetical protein [Natrarchaeobaculum aegyptiacum]ARS90582.1 hypothetical protein B1756_13175 [Natrarchaeobaculum aegyptiacum]
MTDEHQDGHEHPLEAEYLSPTDATVVEIAEDESGEGSIRVDLIVPCPTCSEPVRAIAQVEAAVDADIDLPIEDVEDLYD